MKFKEYISESEEKNLIGMTINGYKITHETKNETCYGGFACNNKELTSLEGSPIRVALAFRCQQNKLTSLAGAPRSVGLEFWCQNNVLTSLDGAPSIVDGDFWCQNNQLTSLKDIHKIIKRIDGEFDCSNNPIKSHVLGLLLIEGVRKVCNDEKWATILNKHLRSGRAGVLAAQAELIEAGLEEYAQP